MAIEPTPPPLMTNITPEQLDNEIYSTIKTAPPDIPLEPYLTQGRPHRALLRNIVAYITEKAAALVTSITNLSTRVTNIENTIGDIEGGTVVIPDEILILHKLPLRKGEGYSSVKHINEPGDLVLVQPEPSVESWQVTFTAGSDTITAPEGVDFSNDDPEHGIYYWWWFLYLTGPAADPETRLIKVNLWDIDTTANTALLSDATVYKRVNPLAPWSNDNTEVEAEYEGADEPMVWPAELGDTTTDFFLDFDLFFDTGGSGGIFDDAVASGSGSVALGSGSVASEVGAFALGYTAAAAGGFSFALGANSTATGNYTLAMAGGSAVGEGSVAIGGTTDVTAGNSVAISGATEAYQAVAIGNSALASGDSSLALGVNSQATGQAAISIGNNVSSGYETVAISTGAESSGDHSVAIGQNSTSSNFHSIALGFEAEASGVYSTAIGTSAKASGSSSVAIGNGNVSSNNSIAMHGGVISGGDSQYSLCMGESTSNQGQRSFLLSCFSSITGGTSSQGSAIIGGFGGTIVNTNGVLIGGGSNKLEAPIGGSVIVGGSNITAKESGAVYAPNLLLPDGTSFVKDSGGVGYYAAKMVNPASGNTLTVTTSTVMTSAAAIFTAAMVGCRILIDGRPRTISAYTSPTQVTITPFLTGITLGQVFLNTKWAVYSRAFEVGTNGVAFYYSDNLQALTFNNTSKNTVFGYNNSISATTDASIFGGYNNSIAGSNYTVIVGGAGNAISNGAAYSALVGGANGVVNSSHSIVLGGYAGVINGTSPQSAIVGGQNNAVGSDAPKSVVIGGEGNTVNAGSGSSVILGGMNNANSGSYYTAIIGGNGNAINEDSPNSVVIGGNGNSVSASTINTVVIGGEYIAGTTPNTVYVPNLVVGTPANPTGIITDYNGDPIGGGPEQNLINGSGKNNLIQEQKEYEPITDGTINVTGTTATGISGDSINGSGYVWFFLNENPDQIINMFFSDYTGEVATIDYYVIYERIDPTGGWSFSNLTEYATVTGGVWEYSEAISDYNWFYDLWWADTPPANVTDTFSKNNAVFGAGNSTTGDFTFIAGYSNTIYGGNFNVIIGGSSNYINTVGESCAILGGGSNSIAESVIESAIIGGNVNTIAAGTIDSAILAGTNNDIGATNTKSVILGGSYNLTEADVFNSAIIGGDGNKIEAGSQSSVILGGQNHTVSMLVNNAVVIGGTSITATESDTVFMPEVRLVGGTVRNQSGNELYALQDGTDLYYVNRWFTPTGSISTTGTTATITTGQFSSNHVGSKIMINGESRVITARTDSNNITIDKAFSPSNGAAIAADWGVYAKALEITGTNIKFNMNKLPVYADQTAATGGGLSAGTIYTTSTGALRIVV
jgi:hypothetical protein